MLSILALSFAVAAVVTLLIVRSAHLHGRVSADHDLSGPQKFHSRAVPRIGGLAIFLGFCGGSLALAMRSQSASWQQIGALVLCSLPAFGAGFLEDLTKNVSPMRRLLAAMLSAGLGAWLLGGVIDRTEIPGLDWIAATSVGSFLLALLVVSGVSNSINIIDGMNGLASMCTAIMLAGLAYVALQVGDQLVAALAIIVIGAALGFFLWNYPFGLVFLGDGGAYFLGFVLAELAILLLVRNEAVSPMFPLLLCVYPVWETVFSMYRRRVVRGRPMGMPDGIHLHSLIYRRLMRWALGSKDAAILTRRNSLTAPYLWVLCSLSVVPASLWWDDTATLRWVLMLFVACYVLLYWRIVRFKAPRWLVVGERRR
ncbi:glycosyltransferase [Pelomonas sp. SE-A7]|uniref:MraY family glycosyltransferase n=1 Tax=Pelomonas sp. SE-A7 TaxID=3054953 RepID=UPI00259CF105|nr:glycosyltransferase [Pelomonas sp. SE-A7]MDM4767501.1 glycosyltransferase [Pelomonas sp. SE-A7]